MKWIERKTVPHFKYGYTVNKSIAEEYKRMYNSHYDIIRNLPLYDPSLAKMKEEKYILYQGAVNEGRSFETLIPAMQLVNAQLIVCGDGNFLEQAKQLAIDYSVTSKVSFKGMIRPVLLKEFTGRAYIGINLVEKESLSNYFSLANRFFDYINAAVPQLCVDYPAYREINDKYHVAELITDLSPANIALLLNTFLADNKKWEQLSENCKAAAKELNWENEEEKLLRFYKNIFG